MCVFHQAFTRYFDQIVFLIKLMQLVSLTKIVVATDFAQSVSKDVQVSPTALQEEVLQLRAAMLLMIRKEAFQPQMRLCSKVV